MLSTAFTANKLSRSTLKHIQKSEMLAPLNSFLACKIVTLKNAGLCYQKNADELGLKAKSTAQSVYKRYIRNNSYLPKKSTGQPPKLSEKTEKKLVRDILKDHCNGCLPLSCAEA